MKIGFHLILTVALIQNTSEAQMPKQTDNARTIARFDKAEEIEDWRIVNDTVMGGISDSEVLAGTASTLVFRGSVSLERNGGFASVRLTPGKMDLSGCKGIALRTKGDGQRYKFFVKTDRSMSTPNYRITFDTQENDWETHVLLFDDFDPSFRGRLLTNYPDIEPSAICTIGILIADKQEGPFRIEIDWVKGLLDRSDGGKRDDGDDPNQPVTTEREE